MLADFREGRFNVLVATCIAEEGLDIPQVGLPLQPLLMLDSVIAALGVGGRCISHLGPCLGTSFSWLEARSRAAQE